MKKQGENEAVLTAGTAANRALASTLRPASLRIDAHCFENVYSPTAEAKGVQLCFKDEGVIVCMYVCV